MAKILQPIFWLTAFGGLGYGLLSLAPSAEELDKQSKNYPGIEKNPKLVHDKQQQFVNVLHAAVESDKPLYRLSKEEIDKAIRK